MDSYLGTFRSTYNKCCYLPCVDPTHPLHDQISLCHMYRIHCNKCPRGLKIIKEKYEQKYFLFLSTCIRILTDRMFVVRNDLVSTIAYKILCCVLKNGDVALFLCKKNNQMQENVLRAL